MPQKTIDFDFVTAHAMPSLLAKMTDNFFVGDVLMQELKPQVKLRQLGKWVSVPLRIAGEYADWYAGNDTHDTIIRNYATNATFSPANQIISCAIDEDEELQASASPDEVSNMLEEKMSGAEETAREHLGTHIYNNGLNARAITGLQMALPTSTLTYLDSAQTYEGILCGGSTIESDAAGYWQPNVDGSGTTAWVTGSAGTFMHAKPNPMGKMFGRIGQRTNRQPNLIVSRWGSWTDYHDSLVAREQFHRPLQKTSLAESGFTSLMYRNAAWIADARAPLDANGFEIVYVIDKTALNVYWDPRRRFYHTKWYEPHNQSARVMYIKNRLQTVFRERRTSGAMVVNATNMF